MRAYAALASLKFHFPMKAGWADAAAEPDGLTGCVGCSPGWCLGQYSEASYIAPSLGASAPRSLDLGARHLTFALPDCSAYLSLSPTTGLLRRLRSCATVMIQSSKLDITMRLRNLIVLEHVKVTATGVDRVDLFLGRKVFDRSSQPLVIRELQSHHWHHAPSAFEAAATSPTESRIFPEQGSMSTAQTGYVDLGQPENSHNDGIRDVPADAVMLRPCLAFQTSLNRRFFFPCVN
ncbi:hypothetical protein CDD83_1217 [Cordyceps sp. RAO-2017]|nr:hypothetical protein CDD83_1217 [Cordyceps sp. RAO-2017]